MKVRADDNLGYWLFYTQRIVAHAFAEVLRRCCVEHAKPYVVTPPQFGVLALLQEIDGVTIGTISQRRRIDAPTVTGIVKRLEQSGLVERRHDEVDRRVVKVYLTAEGRDIMKLLGDEVDNFDEILTRGISEAEQRGILAKFHHIIVNLDAVVPTSGERFGLLPRDFLCEPME
ncbi:MAG TPA: MarR family transcriptional regulator [Ktedonobacteraceae bacterium]|nr:MarR family transcriptional regulator [Ktedonobacteraceae bacterium]